MSMGKHVKGDSTETTVTGISGCPMVFCFYVSLSMVMNRIKSLLKHFMNNSDNLKYKTQVSQFPHVPF